MDNSTKRYSYYQAKTYSWEMLKRQAQDPTHNLTAKASKNADGGKHINRMSKTKKGEFYRSSLSPGPGAYVTNSTVHFSTAWRT
jgi:hypothetical protein